MTKNITHTHLSPLRETLGSKTQIPRQLPLPRQAPAQIGCLPTVSLIVRKANNIYHNQIFMVGNIGFKNQNPSVTPAMLSTRHVSDPLVQFWSGGVLVSTVSQR